MGEDVMLTTSLSLGNVVAEEYPPQPEQDRVFLSTSKEYDCTDLKLDSGYNSVLDEKLCKVDHSGHIPARQTHAKTLASMLPSTFFLP